MSGAGESDGESERWAGQLTGRLKTSGEAVVKLKGFGKPGQVWGFKRLSGCRVEDGRQW